MKVSESNDIILSNPNDILNDYIKEDKEKKKKIKNIFR